jgi:hypothetical protein
MRLHYQCFEETSVFQEESIPKNGPEKLRTEGKAQMVGHRKGHK